MQIITSEHDHATRDYLTQTLHVNYMEQTLIALDIRSTLFNTNVPQSQLNLPI